MKRAEKESIVEDYLEKYALNRSEGYIFLLLISMILESIKGKANE